MRRIFELLSLSMMGALLWSCNIDEELTTALPPEIVLDSETGIYTVKQGREIVIAPSYKSAVGATYRWTMEGEVLGTSSSLSFVREEVGKYFITITVTTDGGSDEEEIRIDVVDLEVPTVSIAGNKHQTVAVGASMSFVASVRKTSLPTTFGWCINGEYAGDEPTLPFVADSVGSYLISATATNEDGTHCDSIRVEVLTAEDMPLEWEFDRTTYHTVVGRKLLIKPSTHSEEGTSYLWQVDGDEGQRSDEARFVFSAPAAGEYTLTATAIMEKAGGEVSLQRTLTITVYEAGTYYRAKSEASKPDWSRVYEYTPAPGQFINELKTGGFNGTQTTPEAAIAYAEARMSETNKKGEPSPNYVSLGGFGGYIVVGFDHSIDNSGDYDLGILGNSFSGSSEPGIVWVMQDENGNGLPDDTWYELAGSETGKEETIQDYSVTYYRPSGPQMPVQWSDNQGNSGEIDYLVAYHRQEYYYPLWIEADSYTLTGTCLKARNYNASDKDTYWVNAEYDWGYADNFSPIDRLTDASNANANADANANHFKISHAIDVECQPVHLEYIDFVKVQVGVNAKSGWLGEVSTEIFGFYDYNMKK